MLSQSFFPSEFFRPCGGNTDGKSEIARNAVDERKFFCDRIDRENFYVGSDYCQRKTRKTAAATDIDRFRIYRDIPRRADAVGKMLNDDLVSFGDRSQIKTAVDICQFIV